MSVLIYQMGRVASVALNKALKARGIETFHAHYLVNGGEHYKRDLDIETFEKIRQYDIVTLVRDPIERNLSEFFRTIPTKTEYNYAAFLKSFLNKYNHIWPLVWYDIEFLPYTGLDLMSMHFDAVRGYQYYSLPGKNIVAIRTDRLSFLSSKIFSEFMNLHDLEIPVRNATNQRPGLDELYNKFCKDVCFPKGYVNFMFNSSYAKTFFTDRERVAAKGRWTCQS